MLEDEEEEILLPPLKLNNQPEPQVIQIREPQSNVANEGTNRNRK